MMYKNYYPQVAPYVVKETVNCGATLMSDTISNCMFVVECDISIGGQNNHKSAFCSGCILGVKHIIFSNEHGNSGDYAFTVKPARSDLPIREVHVSEKEYGKASMINKLVEEGGLYFYGKHSNSKRAEMIVNKVPLGFKEEEYLYYHSGFYEGKFIYKQDPDMDYCVDAPINRNTLSLDNVSVDPTKDFGELFEIMEIYDNPDVLLLMVYMIYGLTYTIFSELGYKINKILALCGKGAESAAGFLQIYCKGREDRLVSLSNNITCVKKYIFDSKDEVLIFKGSGEKLEKLCEIFCCNMCPEIKVNKKTFKLIPKSFCAVVSDNVCEYVSGEYVKEINFENSIPSFEPNAFGRVIKYIIKYIEEKYLQGFFKANIEYYVNQKKDKFTDQEVNEYAILMTVYKIIYEIFKTFGLDTDEILQEEQEEFFSDFVAGQIELTDREALLKKVKASFIGNILDNAKLIKYTGSKMKLNMSDDNMVLLYDDNRIYIHYNHFDKFILPNFSEGMTKKRLLDMLSKEELLHSNNSGRTVRLSVQINGNVSERSDWIAITRSFLDIDYAFPVLPDTQTICGKFLPLLLGEDKLGRKVYLPLGSVNVNNNHIGICGDSGTGKTYLTMNIIKELSKNNVPSVIIDTAESFRKDLIDKDFLEAMKGKLEYISVYNEKIPIDIFARRNITIEGKQQPEKDFDIAMRCTQILSRSCGLSQLQEMEFTEAIMDVFEEKAGETITIRDVYDMLRKNGGKVTATKIDSIVSADVFKNNVTCFNWKNIFEQGKCLIFSLSGYRDERVKRMIAESILQDLWGYALECGNEKNPFAVVCDEIGNTPPRKDSALSNMLHLGRKFGVMCVWNTQFLCGKFKDNERSSLEMSSTIAYFKVSELSERDYLRKKFNSKANWLDFSDTFRKGECIVHGNFCTDKRQLATNASLYVKVPRIHA